MAESTEVERPTYPPTTRLSVQDLTANISLLDITEHIQKHPQYKFSIGTGASGDVYRAIYKVVNPKNEKYDLQVVVKILRGTIDQKALVEKRLYREIACWRNLEHTNVAELLGIARFIPNVPPGLVSKFVPRKDFLDFVGKHPELKRDKAKDVTNGLQYLHEQNVIHGDLKADNVIVSNNYEAQITDFGLAQILDVTGFTTMTRDPGNIRFTAPEMMPDADPDETPMPAIRPTFKSDIFSLGMLLLQLFHAPDQDRQRGLPYNHVRFIAAYDVGLVARIHNGERPARERYNYIEDQHWQVICRCWAGNPDDRPSSEEVQMAL